MRGWVRILIMFAPMIMRQFEKWNRNRSRSIPSAPPQKRKRKRKEQTAAQPEEEYYEEMETIDPHEDEFVDPINK